MPTIARLILFARTIAVVGMGGAAMLEIKAGYYEYSNCKTLFVPSMSESVKGYHTLTKRKLKCLECDETNRCRHHIVR